MRPGYPLLLAVCLPPIFVHIEYLPKATLAVGGTEATISLADAAVVAAGLVGLLAARASGTEPLRRARPVVLSSLIFVGVVFVSLAIGPFVTEGYSLFEHTLTAVKFAGYGLLALAAVFVVRTPADVRPLAIALVLWSIAATGFGLLQYVGVVDEFEGRRPGQREPSFVGIHDFGALSAAAVGVALLAIAFGGDRRVGRAAGITGTIGVVLSGAIAAVLGTAASAGAAWVLARRRALALGAVVALVAAGAVAIRTVDVRPVLEWLGIERPRDAATDPGGSWRQRAALAYIGGRIFLDHPLTGVGWQGSLEYDAYSPYVGDARELFPQLPERVLPSPARAWGVQNAYVQAASDLGLFGLAAWLAFLLVPLAVAWRAGRAAAVPILWLLVASCVWIGIGLVAGTPLGALTWLGVGLCAASAGWRERV